MTEINASVSIWHIRAEDLELSPNSQTPHLLRLTILDDVRIVLNLSEDTAEQAAAMRKLAALATEAAEDLERHGEGRQS